MPDLTTNYNLVKPLKNENYDIEIFNKNADILDRELKSLADSKATTATYTATLTAEGWSASAPYTQTVAVAGILATDNPIVDIVLSGATETAQNELEAWGNISRIQTQDGNILATCFDDKLTVALNVQLKVVK